MENPPYPRIVLDAHQDIAYNYVVYQRDFMQSALVKRRYEDHSPEAMFLRGIATTGLPETILGRVGVIFATLFVCPSWSKFSEPPISYETPQEAFTKAMTQLDYYHRLADDDPRLVLIQSATDLQTVLQSWQANTTIQDHKLGLVILMEGADPIVEPPQVEYWYERGLRIVAPAWTETRYAGGTGRPGPLTKRGYELLEVMASLHMILDLSHMTDVGFLQALDFYQGSIIASHSNPRHFRDTERMLSDEMILRLAERDGVIGVVPALNFIIDGWKISDGKRGFTLDLVINVIDYICQRTGNARHVGIGTDLDGGQGAEVLVPPLDTVSDLLLLEAALLNKGYTDEDVQAILVGNFLRILKQSL